jgi:hypothetical protein
MKSYNVLSATYKKTGAQMAIFVLALGIIFTSYDLKSPAYAWWRSLLQNLGAGLLSTLVVIWLYDELLARQAKRETRERNRVTSHRHHHENA